MGLVVGLYPFPVISSIDFASIAMDKRIELLGSADDNPAFLLLFVDPCFVLLAGLDTAIA